MCAIIPSVRCRGVAQIAQHVVSLGPFRGVHSVVLRVKAPAGVSISPCFVRSEDALGSHATCVELEDLSRQAPTPCPHGLRVARRLYLLERVDPNVLHDAINCGLAGAQYSGHFPFECAEGRLSLPMRLAFLACLASVLRSLARSRDSVLDWAISFEVDP